MRAIHRSSTAAFGQPEPAVAEADSWDANDVYRRIFDGLTVCVLTLAPLLMGGRQPLGRLTYVALVGGMALAWLLRGLRTGALRYRFCGLEIVLLLGTLLIVAQLLPLPKSLLLGLSPRLMHYLPLWVGPDPTASLGAWQVLSLTPQDTRVGLAVWAAHATLLVLLVQRLETREDARRLLRWVAVAGIWISLLGLLQYLFSNGKFLWIYQNPFRGTRDVVRGPFYNENHFAHFLTLTLFPLWVWLRSRQSAYWAGRGQFTLRRQGQGELFALLLGGALAAILFAILLTRSRGGVIVALMAVLLGAWGIQRARRTRTKWGPQLAIVLAVLVTALSIHGLDQVGQDVEQLASTSIDQWDQRAGRRRIWRAARDVLGQFTLAGAGVGSFRETFPLFYSQPRQVDYSYAESGYLQVAVETGLLGTTLLVVGLIFVGRRLWEFWRASPSEEDWEWTLAAVVGICVSLFHSIFDFVWYLPACMSVSLVLLAVLIRWTQSRRATDDAFVSEIRLGPLSRTAMAGAVTFVVLVGLRPLLNAVRGNNEWHDYLLAATAVPTSAGDTWREADVALLTKMRQHLKTVVQRNRTHARAHLRLAATDLRLFEIRQRDNENPMSLAQIRDAALASHFSSLEDQDRWLDIAVGQNRQLLDEALTHASRAVLLSPLQGDGYVYLAELQFLRFVPSPTHSQLIQQALRVRPFDSTVLFAAGREAILAGDLRRAIPLWRRAYHQDDDLNELITAQLAPRVPAAVFVEQFQPRLAQLLTLYDFYRQQQLNAHAFVAGGLFLDRLTAQTGVAADDAHLWQKGYSLAAELHDPRTAMIGRRAVQLDPDDYAMRRRLAFELLDQQDWPAAIRQLSWCLDKNQTDRGVAAKLSWAREQVQPTIATADRSRL